MPISQKPIFQRWKMAMVALGVIGLFIGGYRTAGVVYAAGTATGGLIAYGLIAAVTTVAYRRIELFQLHRIPPTAYAGVCLISAALAALTATTHPTYAAGSFFFAWLVLSSLAMAVTSVLRDLAR